MSTYVLIEKYTVGAGGVSSVTLGSGGTIPQTYTDLLVKCSTRSNLTASAGGAALEIKLNSTGASTYLKLEGSGSAASSNAAYQYANAEPSDFTSNVFGNSEFYLPNYKSSDKKSVTVDSVGENNATLAYCSLNALLFNVTTAITSLTFNPLTSYSFVQYSTFYLYGILKA